MAVGADQRVGIGDRAAAVLGGPDDLREVLQVDGVPLLRAAEPFDDSGRHFGAGAVIVRGNPALANELANQYALDVFALKGVPDGTVHMREQRIAVYGDEGVRHSLDTLGFDYDSVGTSDLNAGVISGYDVFINRDLRWSSLDAAGQASFSDWFAGGGDYVALGYRGRAIDFAVDAGFVGAVDYGYISGNAILQVEYDPDDSVAAGFREDGYAFVYRSTWFTDWPEDMEVSARIDSDSDTFLVSGFWEDWQTSGANGQPVILHEADGDADVTLIGINNTFRGHPEDTFRILGNAIYNGLD